ncbi:hypothetical protein [Allosphingosinicella deserti]|uniref:Uncharacterized protein n=1 Tax=Allosphingosinicella deserti TaxID=2116704 RepID=A0A2P7QLN6_9SPHN|nr:hypothetical protein [Sphingomonas deserti]PSJ38854.1 hypothetical protein C7I55_16130 [Sphingomonas deserti]
MRIRWKYVARRVALALILASIYAAERFFRWDFMFYVMFAYVLVCSFFLDEFLGFKKREQGSGQLRED